MSYYVIKYKSSNGNNNTDYAWTKNFLFELLDGNNILYVDYHPEEGNIKRYYPQDFDLLRKECMI